MYKNDTINEFLLNCSIFNLAERRLIYIKIIWMLPHSLFVFTKILFTFVDIRWFIDIYSINYKQWIKKNCYFTDISVYPAYFILPFML